jgi:hypothetical protein
MKHVCLLIAGMLLVSGVSAQEKGKPIPSIGQLKCITLQTSPTLWEVVFYTNGTAWMVWGDEDFPYNVVIPLRRIRAREDAHWGIPDDAAAAPKGSVPFEEIYNLLIPRLKQDGNAKKDMRVVLYGRNYTDPRLDEVRSTRVPTIDNFSYTGYLRGTRENREIVRKLMSETRDKAVPENKETFEARLRDYPFVAGGKPVAHVYSENLDCAFFHVAWNDAFVDLTKEQKEALKWLQDNGIVHEETERRLAEAADLRKAYDELQKETPAGSAVVEAEGSRPSLYGTGLLAVLCAGVALWFMRKKQQGTPT